MTNFVKMFRYEHGALKKYGAWCIKKKSAFQEFTYIFQTHI